MKKDLLVKQLKIKLQLTQLEHFMMLRDLLVEDIMIRLFNMIRNLCLMILLIKMEDHTFLFLKFKVKTKLLLLNKSQPWF